MLFTGTAAQLAGIPPTPLSQVFGQELGPNLVSDFSGFTIDTIYEGCWPQLCWAEGEDVSMVDAHCAHKADRFLGHVGAVYQKAQPLFVDRDTAMNAKEGYQEKYRVDDHLFSTGSAFGLEDCVNNKYNDELNIAIGKDVDDRTTFVIQDKNLRVRVNRQQTTLVIDRDYSSFAQSLKLYVDLMQAAKDACMLQDGANELFGKLWDYLECVKTDNEFEFWPQHVNGTVTRQARTRAFFSSETEKIPLMLGGVQLGKIEIRDRKNVTICLTNNQKVESSGLEWALEAMIRVLLPYMENRNW